MELFAQTIASGSVGGVVSGGCLTAPRFEALRQSLGLPATVVVDGTLNFQIGCGMPVTALLSDDGQCLLSVELIGVALIPVDSWQSLFGRLTSQLSDELACNLIVLDDVLSMVWTRSSEVEPAQWVREAHQLMAWCLRARTQMDLCGFLAG